MTFFFALLFTIISSNSRRSHYPSPIKQQKHLNIHAKFPEDIFIAVFGHLFFFVFVFVPDSTDYIALTKLG
jgi:hypothetical protein